MKPASPVLPCQTPTFDFRGINHFFPTVAPWNTILLLSKVSPCVWSSVKVLHDQREHVYHHLELSADLLQSSIHHHECLLRSSERCTSLGRKDDEIKKMLLTFDLISVIDILKNTVLTCMVWGTKGMEVRKLALCILDCFLAVFFSVI